MMMEMREVWLRQEQLRVKSLDNAVGWILMGLMRMISVQGRVQRLILWRRWRRRYQHHRLRSRIRMIQAV